MFVDLWIVSLFSLLFGACAVINYKMGVQRGIDGTLEILKTSKVIMMENDNIVAYKEKDAA